MLKHCVYFCLLLPLSAQAFDLNELKKIAENPELMQQFESMGKGMIEAAGCINMESINKIKSESEAMQSEVKTLCAKGDRSRAQKTALQYSQQIMSSNEYKELKECGDKVMGQLPPGLIENIKTQVETASNTEQDAHVCDNL